ncbi:MAG: PP2C family protein-serine/threonine phosphatase, partial [Pseudomonadales bacterium]|nr:PP2C family protein-serine/threonine phosphatase [Pseudomonadales bacterium]
LQVQMKMLPVSPMQKSAYIFHHQIVPSVYLSGDFVEYVTVGADHVVFFMADVSGHGASSAFVTVLMKNLTARMRSDYSRHGNDGILHPAEFLAQANAELLGTGIGKHATLFYAVLDTQNNRLTYSVAGALPVPILITDGEARYLEGQGAPVGLFEQTNYQEKTVDLPDKFRFMMFSDGILEVLGQDSLAKKEAFLLSEAPKMKADIESIFESFNVDESQQYPDDIALLVVDKV